MFSMLILLLGYLSSADAVTLIGSADYAIPGSVFTLICDVPEEANSVTFYRRPDLSDTVGEIQVGGGDQCLNVKLTPLDICVPGVCSCVPTSTAGRGTEFRWVIQPQSGDQGSAWFCRRTNFNLPSVTQDSLDLTLNVADGPGTSIGLSPPDATYTRTERDTLPDITCTADCRPDCTFVWTKLDNTNFTASAVLSLGQLDRSEHGTYRCTAGNVVGESTMEINVIVTYGPGTSTALSPPETSYTRSEGDTLPDITCTADCRPGCTFVWTKPDNTNFTAWPVLSLGQLDKSEQGTYRCLARNEVGTSSKTVTLILNYGPGTSTALSPPETSYTRSEGDTLPDITCTADCRPGCTFVWTKPDNTNFTASSVLSLGRLERSEHGTYRCTAKNTVGESSITISVVVQYGPGTSTALSPPQTSYTRTEGETLPDITCTADCRPGCTFVWTKPDNTNFTASPVLSLGQLDRSEHGTYRCTARNEVGASTTTPSVTISLQYGPGTSTALSPPETSYTRNEGVTLPDITCTADCRPSCTFVWTKPDYTNFTASPVLSLGQLDKSEHGTYRCTARNDIGESFAATEVIVQYGPGNSVALSPSDTTYTRTEGDTLPDITCTADCRPGCTFVWTKPDNTNLPVSAVLSLGQLDRSEHGTYRCTARNVVGESTITISVTVQYGPGMSVALSPPVTNYSRTEGDTLPVITCTADCRPGCTFTWTKPDNTNFTASSGLSLGRLDRSEHGTYKCTARNVIGESALSMSVIVQYGPGDSIRFQPQEDIVHIRENNTVPNVACSADCRPACDYSWSKGGKHYNNPLSLSTAARDMAGEYTCTARNVVDNGMKTWNLFVKFPPKIINLNYAQGEFNTTENERFSLLCTVESYPPSTIKWYFGTKELSNTTNVLQSTYTLNKAGCFNTGLYTCSAHNGVSPTSATRDIPVNVLCKPRLYPEMPFNSRIGIATSRTLSISAVFLSNPKPSFTWHFQNSSVSPATFLDNGTENFVISNSFEATNLTAVSLGSRSDMQEKWFGLYNVTATNSQGNKTISFVVEAQGKPNRPYAGKAVCDVDRAVLTWTSAFNGGATQTFGVGKRSSQQDTFIIDSRINRTDPGNGEIVNTSLVDLEASTQHFFMVYAVNEFGNSTFEEEINCTTKDKPSPVDPSSAALIGGVGGSAAAIVIVIVVIVAIIVKRRTSGKSKGDDTKIINNERRSLDEDDDSSDGLKMNILYESSDGLKPNALYVSAGPQPGTSSEYAVVQKPPKIKPGSPDALYAVVDKSKNGISETGQDLYAHVDKKKTKGKKEKGKGKKKTKAGTSNINDTKEENVYEQGGAIGGSPDMIYENCGTAESVSNSQPIRQKNKDGLIYLDIEFKDKSDGRNFVIHGIENRTDYVEVDFTKQADPMPEETEEKQEE